MRVLVLRVLFLLNVFIFHPSISNFDQSYFEYEFYSLIKITLSSNMKKKTWSKPVIKSTRVASNKSVHGSDKCRELVTQEFLRLSKVDYSDNNLEIVPKYATVACSSIETLKSLMEKNMEILRSNYQYFKTPIIKIECLMFLESLYYESKKNKYKDFKESKKICKIYHKVKLAMENNTAFFAKLHEFELSSQSLLEFFQKHSMNCNDYIFFNRKAFESKVDFLIKHSDNISKLPEMILFSQKIHEKYCEPSNLIKFRDALLSFKLSTKCNSLESVNNTVEKDDKKSCDTANLIESNFKENSHLMNSNTNSESTTTKKSKIPSYMRTTISSNYKTCRKKR